MYWSPDSQFLLYSQRGLWWDTLSLKSMSGKVDMVICRVKDGAEWRIATFSDEYQRVVRMFQRGEEFGFALEPGNPIGIGSRAGC